MVGVHGVLHDLKVLLLHLIFPLLALVAGSWLIGSLTALALWIVSLLLWLLVRLLLVGLLHLHLLLLIHLLDVGPEHIEHDHAGGEETLGFGI